MDEYVDKIKKMLEEKLPNLEASDDADDLRKSWFKHILNSMDDVLNKLENLEQRVEALEKEGEDEEG